MVEGTNLSVAADSSSAGLGWGGEREKITAKVKTSALKKKETGVFIMYPRPGVENT